MLIRLKCSLTTEQVNLCGNPPITFLTSKLEIWDWSLGKHTAPHLRRDITSVSTTIYTNKLETIKMVYYIVYNAATGWRGDLWTLISLYSHTL